MIDATAVVFRYTPHLAALTAFYETVGLRTVLTSDSGAYAELVGTSGRLHLHEGGAAETSLQFFVPDAKRAAAYLEAEGIRHALWDEAYGQQLAVDHPTRPRLWVGEEQHDWYGFRAHDPKPALVSVTAVWYSDDFERDRAYFARFGFLPQPPGDEHWQALAGGADRGVIGLHAPGDGDAVGLSLETREGPDAVAARLQEAGLAIRRYTDEFISYVAVTDPDGVEVQIHTPR